jgi:hypothetical protein
MIKNNCEFFHLFTRSSVFCPSLNVIAVPLLLPLPSVNPDVSFIPQLATSVVIIVIYHPQIKVKNKQPSFIKGVIWTESCDRLIITVNLDIRTFQSLWDELRGKIKHLSRLIQTVGKDTIAGLEFVFIHPLWNLLTEDAFHSTSRRLLNRVSRKDESLVGVDGDASTTSDVIAQKVALTFRTGLLKRH